MWFCVILDGAGDVYHDAPSEPGLGRDPYDYLSCGRIPAVLLLNLKTNIHIYYQCLKQLR